MSLGSFARAALGLFVWVSAAPALAQSGGEARELALSALRLEFERDGVSASEEALAERFDLACDRGYNPACRRASWRKDDAPDPAAALEVFTPSCEAGDQVACLVMGWCLDTLAAEMTNVEDRDRAWRRAARQLKADCDTGFQPACHDYAGYLYDNKGVDSEPAPALRRWNAACDAGEYASCTTLARLYAKGSPGAPASAATAARFAQRACDGKYAAGCMLVGEAKEAAWTASVTDTFYGALCDQGYRDGCWHLARMYYDGIFKEPAEGRLKGLFDQGCSLRHARSCFEAGRWEIDHQGDVSVAAAKFGRACALGDAAGCASQVDLILSGRADGSVKDAFDAFDQACEQRQSAQACTALALALLDGVEVPRDAERARTLLTRVCVNERSDPRACFRLGQSFEDGLGGERDRTVASQFYRWGCAGGSTDSCMRRGQLLTSDVGVRRDDAEALNMFGRACEGGIAAGCREAGGILFEGTYLQRDLATSAEWFARGCDAKDGASCFGLGQVHEIGPSGAPDMAAAREAYERAIAASSLDAKRALARLLWQGFGGGKSRGRAKQLCREACQSGDPVACRGPAFLVDKVE
ncbi:MAG: hypothetical protein ABMA64_07845 [Myxococcota bacterium]